MKYHFQKDSLLRVLFYLFVIQTKKIHKYYNQSLFIAMKKKKHIHEKMQNDFLGVARFVTSISCLVSFFTLALRCCLRAQVQDDRVVSFV